MPALDTDALSSFLAEYIDTTGELTTEGEGGGYSNETLFVRCGDRELVVRRPPPDETADTAHDVLREYRIIDALQDTAVPVAPTICACQDTSVLGDEFYVMDRIKGDVIQTEEPEWFSTAAARKQLATQFIDTLAAIHAVDYEAIGLGELGQPVGYLERQVQRFQEACLWAQETTSEKREVPELYEVGSWLAANVPAESSHSLVHGDYKLDNVMFDTELPPEIIAVFDWEMSTLGDPLADLGYMLHFWPDADDVESDRVVAERFAPPFLRHHEYPPRDWIVDRYETQSGQSFTNRRFYLGLAAFKMAALGEMFYARYLRGGVDDEMYRAMGEGVPAQAERARDIIEGDWTIQ